MIQSEVSHEIMSLVLALEFQKRQQESGLMTKFVKGDAQKLSPS